MLRLLKKLFSRRIAKFAPVGLIVAVLCTMVSMPVFADNNGANQWPNGRIGYRLDTHYGQVAENVPEDIPLFLDDACTQPNGNHKLFPGDWAVVYFPANQYGNYAVTYPITAQQDGGIDDGDEYTTHYIRGSDLKYIVSGTGSFTGTDWNEDTWWNHLPTNIGYTSAFPGNGDTVYVGNSVDGGLGGGFSLLGPDANGNYQLWTGDGLTEVMSVSAFPSAYCYYDKTFTDLTDADYSWSMRSQGWSTAGMHEGSNLISYAGMDASGNYATGQRWIKWDTRAPVMATNLNNTQASFSHNGWLNLAEFKSDDTYVITSRDDTSQVNGDKTQVSGLNVDSLKMKLDDQPTTDYLNLVPGDKDPVPDSNGNYVGSRTIQSIMQAFGVKDDGTGGQGTHNFTFSTVDNAWNTAVIGSSVQIDTIAPTVSYSPNSTSSAWKNSQSVTISASDPGSSDGTGSGLASASYQISRDGGQTWGDSISLNKTATVSLPEGTDVIKTTATDVAGNTSTTNSGTYLIDKTAPSATYTPNTSGWTNNISVTIQPTDSGGSGVKSYVYRVSTDGGSTWGAWSSTITGSGSTAVTLNKQGTNVIQTQVTDNAGNVGTSTSGQYLLDVTPPTATFDPNSSGWTNKQNVTITPHDTGGSGVKSYAYRTSTNGGSTWSAWSSTINGGGSTAVTLNKQGTNVIQAQVTDNAGNVGTSTSGKYLLDTTPPTATFDPNSSSWTNNQSVTITPHDTGGSGVKSYIYRTSKDGGNTWGTWSSIVNGTAPTSLNFSSQGANVIQAQVTDNAGNVGTSTSGQYLIDTTPPVVTYTPNSSPWTNNLTVTINVTDTGGSGVQAAYWHISTDGGKTWTGENEFTTSTTVDLPQGTIMLRTDAYDNAGNSASYDSGIYLIDKTPPVITYNPGSSGSGWKQNMTPSISVTDAGGSGLKSAQYRISTDNGDTWSGFTTFDSNTSVSLPEGRDVLQTVAADNAGNVTTTNSGTYLIDKTPPTCTAHPVDGQFNNTTDGVAVALTYSDNLSGVNASTEQYQWVQAGANPQNNAWKNYSGQPVTQTTKGQWNLYWRASDNAGNFGNGSFGPYYIGSLTGQIVKPGSTYTFGEDVVTSVQVHSDNSGDITPANGASVTFVVKNQAGGVITNQTKALVVPNNQTQLVWFRYTMSGDNTVGDITMTATINSALADAQHNPFSLGNQCGVGLDTTEDDMGDALTMPKEFDKTRLPAPDSNPSSGSWQEWSYNGGFTQHTYTVSASTAFKIAADLNDPTAYTDENGNVTIKSGYGILEKPTTQISYDYYDANAITKAQLVLGLYPEWNYDASGGRVFTQTGIHSALGNLSQTFDLPDNNFFSEPGKLTDAVLSRIKDKDMHFTPLAYPDGSYTAEVQAGDIWTPAGKLQAQATDSMTIQGACTNDWQVTATNPHMLQNK